MRIATIDGYDGEYILYEDGSVYSHKRNRYLTIYPNEEGYLGVKLSNPSKGGKPRRGMKHSIHRLLARYFIPNPLNLETVNHIDKDKTNNSLDNLEWMSREDNVKHGLMKSYKLLSPEGDVVEVQGLAEFCRNNNLTQANMSKVIVGQRPHHKGWRLHGC